MRRRHWCVVLGLFFFVFAGPIGASAESVTVAWDPSPDASVSGYFVYVGNASRTYTAAVDVGAVTSVTLPNMDPGQRYYMAVASYDGRRLPGPPSAELLWGDGPTVVVPTPTPQPPITGPSEPVSGPISGPIDTPIDSPVNRTPFRNSDRTPPMVNVTTSSAVERTQNAAAVVVVGGVARDETAISAIEWKNSRGGSGRATGTDAWLAAIPLLRGRNEVTITAHDAAGNKSSTILILLRPLSDTREGATSSSTLGARLRR